MRVKHQERFEPVSIHTKRELNRRYQEIVYFANRLRDHALEWACNANDMKEEALRDMAMDVITDFAEKREQNKKDKATLY